MRASAWLTARPIAHRGLHDRARGIVENMPGAALAAVAGNFSIECDIQLSADGEAMVHHDDALGRLTEGSGALTELTLQALKAVRFKDTAERMMTLGDLCALVSGRVGIVIEVKSHFDGDRKLVTRMAEVLGRYLGPVAGMSFDPDQVLAMREAMPELTRGIVAQRVYNEADWREATAEQRRHMLHLSHALHSRPHFVAYSVNDLPAPAPWIARHVFGLPAHAGAARARRALRRSDHLRRFSTVEEHAGIDGTHALELSGPMPDLKRRGHH